MKAYDEDAKYILFINKSITILDCSTVNSLMIDFLGHISQHIGRCVPCTLVVLLTKECGDTDMTCKWDVGVYLTEYDQPLSTLLSRVAREGYGYKRRIWVYMSLRLEITMVTCKQLIVLWCRTIWIFNSVMKSFWIQSSTYKVSVWVKIKLILLNK